MRGSPDRAPIDGARRGGVSPQAWLAVGLLSFLYAASFVDRMILSLLMDPIGTQLGLSETQLSLLFGLAFGIAYICAGLPLAHLADRGNRLRILVGGVLLWSLATAMAGFGRDFTTLAIARAGVGIGEAVLTPVAVSLIADLFPAGRRSLPMSVYATVGAVMGTGSLIVGGGAVWLASLVEAHTGIAAWRLTFGIVSLPGVLGALAVLILLEEPERTGPRAEDASMQAAITHLRANWALYMGLFTGVGFALTLAMGTVAWAPTMLARDFGFTLAQAGAVFGTTAVCGSVVGTFLVPLALRRSRDASSTVRRIVLLAPANIVVAAPVLILCLGSSKPTVVLLGIAVGMAGLSASALLPQLIVPAVAPPRLRARCVAVYLLISTVISLGLGPVLVSTILASNPSGGIAGAIRVTAAAALIVTLACYVLAFRGAKNFIRRNHDFPA